MSDGQNEENIDGAADGGETPAADGHDQSEQTRREFIERLRGVAAIPVVAALGLSWTKDAKAY